MCKHPFGKSYVIVMIVLPLVITSRIVAGENDDWHFYGENIALHKNTYQLPATFFDQYSSPSKPERYYRASLSVDGNADSNFKHGSCSHTMGKASVDASWTVDLGKPFNITEIVIYNRDDVKDRLKNFQIYGDDYELIHNSSGTDEYKETILTFKLDGLRSFSKITVLLPKHLGYSDAGDYFLTLCEVQIHAAARHACDVTQTNVTNGRAQIHNCTGREINHLYTVGTIIEVCCAEKFHSDGATRFECLASGEYDYPISNCIESLCKLPNVTNGRFLNINLLPTKFEAGTTLQFTCDPGFTAALPNTIKCEEDFQWSSTPECQVESDSHNANPVVTEWVVISVVLVCAVLAIFTYRRRKKLYCKKLPCTGEVPGRVKYTQTCADDDLCIDTMCGNEQTKASGGGFTVL